MIRPFSVRGFHLAARILNFAKSGSPSFAYTTGANDLKDKIDALLTQPSTTPETHNESVMGALKACHRELRKIHDHDKFDQDPAQITVKSGLQTLLSSEQVQFDQNLLKSIFLMNFPSKIVIDIIHTYYKRNPSAAIDLELALIPLRQSLFNAELKDAVKITDLTTGHVNYVHQKNQYMRKNLYRLAATAVGVTLFSKFGTQMAVDSGLLLETWRQLSTVNSMVLTYILNSSFFVTVVRFGRQLSAAGGDYLTWQKGTFYTHWYRYCDLMAMYSKIVEADVKLNGGVESSDWLIKDLCRTDSTLGDGYTLAPGLTREGKKVRLLEARESLEDLKLQAYWMTGGDGFEWVEPDQDPAEIIWRKHLEHLHSPALGLLDTKTLKWAEELIEEKKV